MDNPSLRIDLGVRSPGYGPQDRFSTLLRSAMIPDAKGCLIVIAERLAVQVGSLGSAEADADAITCY